MIILKKKQEKFWIENEAMNKKEIEKIYVQLQRYARYKFINQEQIDDFPGWAITKIIEKGYKRFDFLYTEYLREKLGRSGTPRCIGERGLHNAIAIDKWEEIPSDTNKTSEYGNTNSKFNIELFVELLTDSQRDIGRDALIYGMTHRAIADKMNITESRISQIMKGINKLLLYKMMEDEYV